MLSKAFQFLPHILLIAKLHAYGFDKASLRLKHGSQRALGYQSYLKNTTPSKPTFLGRFFLNTLYCLCKDCKLPPPEKVTNFLPSNSPLQIEVLSSLPFPKIWSFNLPSTEWGRGGGVGCAHCVAIWQAVIIRELKSTIPILISQTF